MSIKNLFSEKQKVMSQKSISDITGSATPVESSDYIDNYLAKKERFLPPINFATASNFAKFGSAKQYSADAVQRIYNTYPYDGSLSEKISWLNSSNFYDLYIFNHEYPRTCGYAVFSPLGWGSRVGVEVNAFGYSDSLEYIQLKGGPHPDPSSGSLKLSRQFPSPYDGKANLYDVATGINRESNLALDLDKGVTAEYWIKGPSSAPVVSELAGKTTTQVSFDLWNGYTGTSEGNSYGRFMLYNAAGAFRAIWASGSALSQHTIDTGIATALTDGNWHHIAVTAKQVPDGSNYRIEWNDFLDGNWLSKEVSSPYSSKYGAVTGSLIANIGAARLPTTTQAQSAAGAIGTMITNGTNDGFGKLSGSIDEFRYWKTARTPQEIKRFWNTQIAGGSNTDGSKFSGSAQPVDLGVYYKFNEGNVGNAIVDSSVLDYSGRISNGTWAGYIVGSSRVAGETSSAIIESSASTTEFKDPIIYSSHPDVSSLYTVLTERGEEWDLQNNMALYHTMPEWITSEDQDEGGEQLKKLTQIIASYLDTVFLQIQALPSITKNQYPYEELTLHNPNELTEHQTDVLKYSNSPVPFARNLIEDLGMGAPEIFAMADELAILGNRDDIEEFDQKLYDIKNTIYQNIYNNLSYIYKSKGTEKSFRNLIRCYGVDDELIKINLYIDGATYSFSDSDYRSTSVKDKYIDFNDADRNLSTIYQSASLSTSNSISYIPGWNPTNADTAGATGSAMTFEADVIFPYKFERNHPSNLWYSYPDLTSSIFGCHTAQPTISSPEDFGWVTGDSASFQVHALRDIEDSKDVRFMLTSSNGSIPTLTSDLFQEVYDDNRWLFAVKVYPESPLEGKWVSAGGSSTVSGSWTMEFQGYNPLLDQMQNSFSVSASIPAKDGTYFMNANKRIYAGAHRENFSGSLDIKTDIKIGSVRVWDDYLTDFDLSTHAKDPTNYGRSRVYKNSYLFSQDTTPGTDIDAIPQFETLLLNWTFKDVTGSTNGAYLQDHYGGSAWDGSFEILDYSSGSDDRWEVPSRYKYHYTGRGDWFLPEDTTNLVDSNYLSVVKTNLPEVSSGEDMISILNTDDNYFTRDSKSINHYFAIEKSMYQTISEEMLKIFATAVEFNNLVGEPVNRYRQEYKSLGKLREAFFRKVGNTPDFNRFVNFYKWIDDSLTDMLMQLVPMSANFSTGVKTMVESHILERNKYCNKFPTLEIKADPIVGRLKGINELSYDWEHGHAPLNPTPYINEGTNCLWWKDRSEASASFTAGNQVDTDRNVLRRILTSDVTTNKILATGEYTDPTNYPNSGFPNAAEFNLAQDGANLAARTQYKGSTYALRSFSKPYKLESEEAIQIHGGINYHANKRRELTKHWVTTASPTGRTLASAPWYTDDLKDCEDVLDPSEKKFHSYAIDADGGSSLGEGGTKGAHYGIFNLVSSSVTTNASLAETGIDIVNLHDDSYGSTNERPMQGPFTERHVGGMAHRHQDISDTTHTNLNRTENFRITNLVKDLRFYVSPGDYLSYNTREVGQPFDRFYRDGVAKRPVNIRNILTTTDSALSQSALGNYESEIQILNTHNEGGTFLAKMQAATGSDGFYTINSPNMSLVISDTADTPKLLAVGKTLLDSSTALLPPYSTSQFSPYLSKNKITERFSAPGDPSTAGDAFGGFGIDKAANKYSVYNALPWRNRQVRFPTNALLTAHAGKYGSFSGSALGATDVTTAATASFHKAHRNTDYVVKYVDDKIGDAGTTYCAQRFDNYYIQHPIPANDFGYAWITASADHTEGCELLTTASFVTASDNGSYVAKFNATQYGRIFGFATLPVSDFGGSKWNTLTQFVPTDFVGLNSIVYEPVDAPSNKLGYEALTVINTDGGAGVKDVNYINDDFNDATDGTDDTAVSPDAGGALNVILLNRNGPYGYPSWKQIRGGDHPIIREHKKSNTHSMLLTNGVIQGSRLSRIVANKTGAQPNADELGAKHHESRFISNIVESPVSINHPLVTRVETVVGTQAQELTVRHTYANNLVTFANPIRRKMVDRRSPKEQPRQTYDDFKDIYLSGDEDPSVNPVSGFKSLIYKQTIYPKLENTYISGSRRRLAYAETAAHISQSKNGEYRTFWKDNLEDRRREDGALNSMGYPIYANPNIVTATGVGINVEKLVLGRGTLSSWPLDTGAGAADASFEFLKTFDPHVAAIRGCYSVTKSADVVPVTEGDQFGGVWGELQRNTLGTLFGSLNTAKLASLNGLNTRGDASNYHHFLNDTHIKTHGTASQFLDHYTLAGSVMSGHLLAPDWEWIHVYPITLTNTDKYLWIAGTTPQRYGSGSRGLAPSNWTTHYRSGRNPWFNSYEDYADDINSMGKEYTVLPEFKISEHIDHYINSGGFKSPRKNYKFLSLPGAPHSASADTYYSDYNHQFWKEYTHSDFMKDFEMIQSDHEGFADISVIDLKCSAVKKLLPYDGFYPAQRCLQLGALMSSSYSQYLGGSSEADYGPEDPYDSQSKYRAERLQSLLQPFYAPGIMYNSIKSGVAVDYPIHTSQASVSPYKGIIETQYSGSAAVRPAGHVNSCSASLSTIISSPDMRMPFEALINPDAYLSTLDDTGVPTKMYLTAPYYGSSSFYATWDGDSRPQYRMAMNNFAAEVPNFFLKEKTLTTFTSAPQSKFKNFVSGTTYYMDIVLEKTPDLIMNSHFLGEDALNILAEAMGGDPSDYKGTTQLVGWGYGPQYWITSSLDARGQIAFVDSGGNYRANRYDPAFAVHSPPYLYGAAAARISFKPHEAVEMAEGEALSFSLDSILAQSQRQGIEYIKEYGVGQPGALSASLECLGRNLDDSVRYPGKDHQMHISSSVNLFGTTHIPLIDYDASSGNPITATAAQTEANKAWVLHTKWETPVLNFANGTGGGLGPNETDEDMLVTGSWWELHEIPFALQRPLGMWKGHGSIPTGDSGIHLKIRESFPEKIANRSLESSLTGSLIESCGFQAQQKKVGELAESKWISEAVVAIPFVDIEGERKFFALGNTLAQSRDIFLRAVAGEEGPGRSIKQLANKMPRYVLPPHLDFLNDDAIEPFAMYIFEFSHKLSQQDLSNIWQNVMPDIAVTAEKSTSALSHTTGENEFFRGNKLPDNTRWMVFKVKQRAAMNYFKMTADSKDDHNFKFDFNANAELDYNYNWPYDYFSLVELAKLDVKIGLGDDAFPIPPVFTPIMGSTITNMAAITPVSPMVANPDNLNLGSLGTTLPVLTFQSDTGTQAAYDVSKQKAAFQLGKAASMGATGLLSTMKKLTGGGNN